MYENFDETHQNIFGKPAPRGGYPDHGNGFYSTKLSYKDWYEFQLAQRSHKNLLEFVTVVVCALLIVGVVFPITSLILGSSYLITAILYKIGFTMSPEKRIVFNSIRQLSALGLLIMAIVASVVWSGKSPIGENLPSAETPETSLESIS